MKTANGQFASQEQTDLEAVRGKIAAVDAEIEAMAADLPAVELRDVMGRPEPGDGDLLSKHQGLVRELDKLRRAEQAALQAVADREVEQKRTAMAARSHAFEQHLSAAAKEMLKTQVAMTNMYSAYARALDAVNSALACLPPGPMAARGGPGASVLNPRYCARLMQVHLVKLQRELTGEEPAAWLLKTGTLEFEGARGHLPDLKELIEADITGLKKLAARDWAAADAALPPPKRQPVEPLELVINASSVPFSPPVKPEAEPGVVNLSSTEFAPPIAEPPGEATPADDGEAA